MLRALAIAGTTTALLLTGAATASATPAPIDYHSSSCPTSLTYNEDDGCVVYLQQMRNTLGFGLSVDGQFGANTESAVKWVQTKAHLQDGSVSVDGQAGPVTKGWIDKFYEGTAIEPGPSNACAISLNAFPNSGTASANIAQINDSATCTGWLQRSDDGGKSWIQESSQHTIAGPGQYVTTYAYSDDADQIAQVCVHYVGSGENATTCTTPF